ncbi:Hypothetical predicted protein [Mytilus galloprovincialis]|uniref:DZANK-type domain-containing protein n=1 Tax=Mytilus galloprovincialis TaxID=29158 RepID=A0A8B6HCK6_MYTGA|nr:Hypothetical predicted protein [Mytilus galloprovincialis]
MKCTNESCGGEFPAGAKFCTGCGMEVQTTVPVKSTLCPSCNNIVLEGYKFCYICGEKINPALFINRVCSGTKDNGQKCNTVLNLGSRFCQSCGTPQDTSYTSSNFNLPGDVPLKLSLQISHQKEDNLERTIPVVQEEHVSSGSSSPDLWEVPTITLDSKDNKTESVKEILQQDDSQINLPKIEPSSTSKITSTHEQDVETIDTGQDCSSKLDNEVLEISDQQSDEAQESLQTVPVEMESPVLTDQQTVEPQKSSHTGPVDKEVPEVMDQRHVIGKPQGNDLTGTDGMEGIGQTDQQNGEPKCSEFSSPVDKEGQGRRDHQIDVPHGNQYADPEDKANQNLSDKKAVETQAESILSDREKQAVKTETSTSEVENSIDDKEESAEEMDASEKNHETNEPMQKEPELTNMETQSTDPQSGHSNNNGDQDTVKSNNVTEIDDEKTQLKVEESKTDESCNQGQKEKGIHTTCTIV